jgi:hypothetical protein
VFRRRPLCDYILPKRRGGSRRSMLSLRRCTVSSYAAIDNSQTTPTPSLPCTKPAKPPSRPLVSISKAEQAFVCMLYHHHHHHCICGTRYTTLADAVPSCRHFTFQDIQLQASPLLFAHRLKLAQLHLSINEMILPEHPHELVLSFYTGKEIGPDAPACPSLQANNCIDRSGFTSNIHCFHSLQTRGHVSELSNTKTKSTDSPSTASY